MDETDAIFDEISCTEIQNMMDKMLGNTTFSFSDYVTKLMHGQIPFSLENSLQTIGNGLAANLVQERKLYIYLILLAVIGAVLGNFATLLQGKQVAQTAFYAVYLLFFSVLITSFAQVSQIAETTLEQLLEFMKVLLPSYFATMAFSQGTAATGVYYEFALSMITIVDYVLLKFVFPAIQVYFLLCIANQLSRQDMFSKMAELIQDFVKFIVKAMFGIMMGINVVQGLVLPVTSQLQNSVVLKMSGAIPGVGNTVSSVASTVLCAGTLVKNAVGITGVIAVALYCGIPLLRLVLHKFFFQMANALIQPVSDKRVIESISSVVSSFRLLIYAVFAGCMMFVVSIALMSAMTSFRQ